MAEKVINKWNELDANSVTPEEFKEVWGISQEEHLSRMMDYMHKRKAEAAREKEEEEKLVKTSFDKAETERLEEDLLAAISAAVTRESRKKVKRQLRDVDDWTALTTKMLFRSGLDYTFKPERMNFMAAGMKDQIETIREAVMKVRYETFGVEAECESPNW